MGTPEVWRELEAQFREHSQRGLALSAYVHLERDYQASLAAFRAYGRYIEQSPEIHPVQMESYRRRAEEVAAGELTPRHPIGNWALTSDSRNTPEGTARLTLFESLAVRAALHAAVVQPGASSDAAIHEWLHLIRSELPHQVWMDHVIENVWSASALMCHVLQTRALNVSPPSPAEAIERYRTECGFSVDALATQTGITPRTVHKHLAGDQIRLNHTRAYADVFSEALGRQVRPPEFQTPKAAQPSRKGSQTGRGKISNKSG